MYTRRLRSAEPVTKRFESGLQNRDKMLSWWPPNVLWRTNGMNTRCFPGVFHICTILPCVIAKKSPFGLNSNASGHFLKLKRYNTTGAGFFRHRGFSINRARFKSARTKNVKAGNPFAWSIGLTFPSGQYKSVTASLEKMASDFL